jgi:hypothetical protein
VHWHKLFSRRSMQRLLVPAILTVSLLGMSGQATSGSAVTVHLAGEEQIEFRWATDRCNDNDIPDAPARAFRDGTGQIQLLATHYDNRLFTVTDGKLKRSGCRIVLDSAGDPNPAHYRDRRWIAATWTDDGKLVHALVHHEYQGHRHPGACSSTDYISCWYNTITYARSNDGGQTFVQSDPPEVVAAAPFEQSVGQGRHRGFFSPTNIIRMGKYWYVMIYTTGWDGQPAGMCVFQTSDVAQPGLWRAWNGKAFESRFGDPYSGSANPSAMCRPVTQNWFGSIQRVEGSDSIIAVFFHEAVTGGVRSWQLAYSVSQDLIAWNAPIDLKALSYLGSRDCSDLSRYAYPSLIDLTMPSRNFDTIGASADLFVTRLRVKNCRNSFDRDLVRYRIRLDRPD